MFAVYLMVVMATVALLTWNIAFSYDLLKKVKEIINFCMRQWAISLLVGLCEVKKPI